MTTIQRNWVGSPNFLRGRFGYKPEAIVIHIMQGQLSDTDSWFATTKSQVSAHYGIGLLGEVHQYVQEGDSAWHAGRVNSATWALIRPGINPNFYTIGIEHEGQSGAPWTEDMSRASSSLIADIANRWGIPLDRLHVIGHHEIYSLKPFCPGNGIDLDVLIAKARALQLNQDRYALVPLSGTTTAATRLNVRRAAPTTNADVVQILSEGAEISYIAWTSSGEAVHGNAHWYQLADGNFVWAGGTVASTPQVSELSAEQPGVAIETAPATPNPVDQSPPQPFDVPETVGDGRVGVMVTGARAGLANSIL